jgi:septal ring factor EnvC (AmiA/AmiB activator)
MNAGAGHRRAGPALAAALAAWLSVSAHASTPPPGRLGLAERLTGIRNQVLTLEQEILDGLRVQKRARANLTKIKVLTRLQEKERELGRARLDELQRTITELELRRATLKEKVGEHQVAIRLRLRALNLALHETPRAARPAESEAIDAPRRKVLAGLVDRELREIETLHADLADADHLETRIQEEQQQLAYLLQDMKEQESVLELNRQLQVDVLTKRHAERVGQLENYRKLKTAESQVERLITDFNARKELEKSMEQEREAMRGLNMNSAFARLKGRLAMPVAGKVVSSFGRAFDPKSNLHVFKKGIDIDAGPGRRVTAVHEGKVAFAGELPNYGRVTIIDHGDHFYSLCAHLGELTRKVGEQVAAGDVIGVTDASGAPIYFEIRSRNVAVNPLQWISN